MRNRVWLMAQPEKYVSLERALVHKDLIVSRIHDQFSDFMFSLYDATGLLLIDGDHPESAAVLRAGGALVPVLAIADQNLDAADEVMRMSPAQELNDMIFHIVEILNQKADLRRYPRAPVNLEAEVNGHRCRVLNASMYGVWINDACGQRVGDPVNAVITLSDGACLQLDGQVVAAREDGAAVRVRPKSDADLVLWLHLILGALSESPLHRNIDPFGPLFR